MKTKERGRLRLQKRVKAKNENKKGGIMTYGKGENYERRRLMWRRNGEKNQTRKRK